MIEGPFCLFQTVSLEGEFSEVRGLWFSTGLGLFVFASHRVGG